MALTDNTVVTREMVYEWLVAFNKSKQKDLRKYLEGKLAGQTPLVDTRGRDGRDATTPLIDLILDDAKSYGVLDGE